MYFLGNRRLFCRFWGISNHGRSVLHLLWSNRMWMHILAKPLDPVVHNHLSHIVGKLLDLLVDLPEPSYKRILNGINLGVGEPLCIHVKEWVDQRRVCVPVMDDQLQIRPPCIIGNEDFE